MGYTRASSFFMKVFNNFHKIFFVSTNSANLHHIYKGLRYLKNYRMRKAEDFGYGFCSNNALYSASLPFTKFIFLLNHFNT